MCALENELEFAECLLSHYYTFLFGIGGHEENRFFLSVNSRPLLTPVVHLIKLISFLLRTKALGSLY